MFTGIVMDVSSILKARLRDQVVEITVARPSSFIDIKTGDSICVDGVCLTVEKLNLKEIVFALAEDTLKSSGWQLENLKDQNVNMELSLKLNDRVGGHYVTGHIDGTAEVVEINKKGENQFLVIKLPDGFENFLWKKGYITINGVSLTIQEVFKKNRIRLGIVPETLKRTNLSLITTGSFVTFEVCYLARAWWNYFKKVDELKNIN